MKRHKIELGFGVWDFEDIHHQELTDLFELKPTKEYFKGILVNPKLLKGKLATSNGWIIKPENVKEYDDFETQMSAFILLAQNKIEVFTKICSQYHCEFSCAIFLEANNGESTPYIHLGKEYNELFGKLNVHFDIDLYC